MTEFLGRTRNYTDTPNRVTVMVDSITAVMLFPANERRSKVIVSNPNNQGCFVRFQSAGVDNSPRDYYIPPNSSEVVIDSDTVYTGEISIIMALGGSKTIHAIEL